MVDLDFAVEGVEMERHAVAPLLQFALRATSNSLEAAVLNVLLNCQIRIEPTRRIYAAHCQEHGQQRSRVERLAGRRELAPDEIGDLIDRIDAERAGRALVTGLTRLPASDRAVVELVDLAGLQPREAAQVLGLAPGTLRMRLLRARARLRTAAGPDLAHGTDPASEPEVKA